MVFWLLAVPLRADTSLWVYTGRSFTDDSPLTLRQPAKGTHLTLEGVAYDDQSFTSPYYYGLRWVSFFPRRPAVGWAIDFFHYKIYSDPEQRVRVQGVQHGAPVDTVQRIGATVQRFNISHWVNYLALNVLGRARLDRDSHFPAGRMQPYVGTGVAVLILHPDSTVEGEPLEKYEIRGPGFQIFTGVNFWVSEHWGFFVEHRWTYADVSVSLKSGKADTRISTRHLVFGSSYRF